MTTQQLVQSWIEWCRDNLDPNADLPIHKTAHELGAPWTKFVNLFELVSGTEHRELFDCLTQAQAANPADLPARFPAIHLCRCLLSSDPSDAYPLSDFAPQALDEVRRKLDFILGFLKPDECPADWRLIKFEILASFALKKWERARQLYDVAEHAAVLDNQIVHALRGQFSFLVALCGSEEDVTDGIAWEPRLLGSDSGVAAGCGYASDAFPLPVVDRVQRLNFLLRGIQPEKKAEQPSSAEHESLRLAIHNLEMALDGPSVLSPVYRCILARSYFELGDFSNAARHYRILLRSDVQLLVDLGLKGGLYHLAARSARLAGQSREAQQIVNEWRAECPADAEAILEQAELQARESRYAEAAEAFKEAVRLRPELELGLGARIALALGGISGNAQAQAELCRQLSKEYPQVCELVSRICAAYWPPFATLCQEARDSWKKAILTYYWFALEADAITKFAMAVEIELRSGVFVPFKHAVSESPEFQNAAPGWIRYPGRRNLLLISVVTRSLGLGTDGDRSSIGLAKRPGDTGSVSDLAEQVPAWGHRDGRTGDRPFKSTQSCCARGPGK